MKRTLSIILSITSSDRFMPDSASVATTICFTYTTFYFIKITIVEHFKKGTQTASSNNIEDEKEGKKYLAQSHIEKP